MLLWVGGFLSLFEVSEGAGVIVRDTSLSILVLVCMCIYSCSRACDWRNKESHFCLFLRNRYCGTRDDILIIWVNLFGFIFRGFNSMRFSFRALKI